MSPPRGTRRLKLNLLARGDFSKFYESSLPVGGLFVPGTDVPNIGEKTTVEVLFQQGPRLLLHGTVTWRRAAGDARARPGVGVSIDASEQSKMVYLLAYVRGGLMDVRQRRRLPLRLRVAYGSSAGRRLNFTRDLNENGAFIRSSEVLEPGARTVLSITPPGGDYRPIDIHATVRRVQDNGADRGAGLRFDFQDAEERSRWEAFVRKLESDYLEGQLPDEALL